MATDKRNRKQKKELARQLQSANPGLDVVHPRAAGIDVGNGAHYGRDNFRNTSQNLAPRIPIDLIGMRTSGEKAQSAFYGRYFMMGYLGVCLVTFVLSQLRP
jgi:hypothetical protein